MLRHQDRCHNHKTEQSKKQKRLATRPYQGRTSQFDPGEGSSRDFNATRRWFCSLCSENCATKNDLIEHLRKRHNHCK